MFTYTAINKCSSYFHRRIFSSRPASLSTKWGDLLKRRNGVDFKERGMVLLSFGSLRGRGLKIWTKIGGLGHSPVAQLTERCTDVASAATNDQVRSGYNRFKPISRHRNRLTPNFSGFRWFGDSRILFEKLLPPESLENLSRNETWIRFYLFFVSHDSDFLSLRTKIELDLKAAAIFFRLSFVASQGKKLLKKNNSAVAMLSGSVRRKDTGSCQPLSRLRASFQRRSPE